MIISQLQSEYRFWQSGNLSVSLARVSLGPVDAATIPGLRPGEYLRLDVEDKGPGIDEKTLARIFEPYFTTKEQGKGTWLGLALAHGIVKDIGGSIVVKSTLRVGTVFSVYQPSSQDAAETVAEKLPEIPAEANGYILLVDDEPALARLGKKMLESYGYKVKEVTDSLEALRIFETDRAGFDAIVTDQTMPGLTGAELIHKARIHRSSIPAVMCTGYSDLIDEEGAKERGIAGFIQKPFNKISLGTALARALGRNN